MTWSPMPCYMKVCVTSAIRYSSSTGLIWSAVLVIWVVLLLAILMSVPVHWRANAPLGSVLEGEVPK